jgi:hypothetical protein
MNARRDKGEGAVFQRPDGRWEARLELGWANGNGSASSSTGARKKRRGPSCARRNAKRPRARLSSRSGRRSSSSAPRGCRPCARPCGRGPGDAMSSM